MVDKVTDPLLESTKAQQSIADLQYKDLLPDPAIQKNFIWQWAVLISRVITKYLPAFKTYRKNVIFHIPHKYSEEMAQKSETVSLIIVMKMLLLTAIIIAILQCRGSISNQTGSFFFF